MRRRRAALGSALFFLAGPGLEAGAGPWALTGFRTGSGLPGWVPLRVAGALLVVAGLAVLLDVFRRFATEGAGTPSPAAPTRELIVTGAYRWVRNPMYVATAAVIAGEALLLRRAVLLIALAAYVLALSALGRFVEEPRLARRFGASYERYRAAVPAWLPRRPH